MHPTVARGRILGEGATPLWGALVLTGFLAATAFWPGIVDGATAPRWAVLGVLVPLCLLLAGPARVRPMVALAALAFLGAAALSISWAPDRLSATDELVHMTILAAAMWLGASLDDLSPFWGGAAAGVSISVLLAVAQTFGFDGVPQAVSPAGLFGNKNVLAEACLLALVVAWALPFALLGLALAGSKAALGAATVMLAVWLRKRAPLASKAILAGLVLALVWLVASGNESFSIRLGYWTEAASAMTPLGHGIGSFAAFNPEAEFAHSEVIQLAFEMGLIGLLLVGVYAYAMGGIDVGAGVGPELVVLVGVGAVSLFGFALHMPLTAVAASLAVGRLARARMLARGGVHDGPTEAGVRV
jgi:hypothetical protein